MQLHFITPGRPMENGYIKSFHGKFREECLNEHWLLTLDAARDTIESWRLDYNQVRPHSALTYRTPEESARAIKMCEANHAFLLPEWPAACSSNGPILSAGRLFMEIATLGIDLSKTTFHVIGLNTQAESVLRRKLSGKQLLVHTSNRQQLLIGMEACGGAHCLARALREQGHDVRLMQPSM